MSMPSSPQEAARSSAAVHVSNLMKKGHIAGRGYILRTAPYAVVVGGANMDIGGRSMGPLVPRDSNPGQGLERRADRDWRKAGVRWS